MSAPSPTELPIWIDGELRPRTAAALRADDSAALEGRGCYTTVLVRAGAPSWPERHAARLRRDAASLGLGEVDAGSVSRALTELALAAFGRGDGAIRLQASRDGGGDLHLLGVPRPLREEPGTWAAIQSTIPHPGPTPWAGVKVSNRLEMGFAREQAKTRGADEAILFDREGFAVEGARSNLLFVDADGGLHCIDLRRGAVAGVALEVLREALPGLPATDLPRSALRGIRELVAVNSLRGARPIVSIDGDAVGDGRPGPAWRRIVDALALP